MLAIKFQTSQTGWIKDTAEANILQMKLLASLEKDWPLKEFDQ